MIKKDFTYGNSKKAHFGVMGPGQRKQRRLGESISFLRRPANHPRLSGLFSHGSVGQEACPSWVLCPRCLKAVIEVPSGLCCNPEARLGTNLFLTSSGCCRNSFLCGCKTDASGFFLAMSERPPLGHRGSDQVPTVWSSLLAQYNLARCIFKASRRLPRC